MKGKIKLKELLQRSEKSSFNVEEGIVQEIMSILEFDFQKVDSDIGKSLLNYVIIRLVSAIESFFGNSAREIIDSSPISLEGIFPKNELTIPTSDLDDLKNEKISKGRIVAYAVNFQNLQEINRVFSKLLSLKDFEEELRKNKPKIDFDDNEESVFEFDLNEVKKLLDLRHKIIHEMIDFEGDSRQLKKYLANTLLLFAISNELMDVKYPDR